MNYRELFEGLKLFEIKTFGDSRGYFRESFVDKRFAEQSALTVNFVQDNEAFSKIQYTLRGLHFQANPKAQGKYVRVLSGSIFDVALDLRKFSPSFGQWRAFELSAENGSALFVPEGFAHGYLTLAPETLVVYKVTDYYAPECEGGIVWNDPALGINWPLNGHEPVMSEKDGLWPTLAETDVVF